MSRFIPSMLSASAIALAILGVPSQASAVAIYTLTETVGGNDCAGALGTPPNCSLNGSPMIAKYDFQDDGMIKFTPGTFASIVGTEFTFEVDKELNDEGKYEWANSGSWSYVPGLGDPAITGFTAKGGPAFNIFLGSGNNSNFMAPNGKGISHLVFFDTEATPVPLPAALPLFAGGLGGLGLLGWWRRRKAASDNV